jgi:hypothetical protein
MLGTIGKALRANDTATNAVGQASSARQAIRHLGSDTSAAQSWNNVVHHSCQQRSSARFQSTITTGTKRTTACTFNEDAAALHW